MKGITLLVEDPNWRSHRGLQARLKQAAEAARRAARLKGGFCILLADNKTLRRLNRDFRGKDKATNVLSFPGNSFDGRTAGRFASAAAPGVAARAGAPARGFQRVGRALTWRPLAWRAFADGNGFGFLRRFGGGSVRTKSTAARVQRESCAAVRRPAWAT